MLNGSLERMKVRGKRNRHEFYSGIIEFKFSFQVELKGKITTTRP